MELNRFAKYAWGVLAFNLLVILWGAYVRASGSGAGCGNHWPLCNGEVVPRSDQIETLIEFTHRITSGVAFVLVVGLLIWALRAYPTGSVVRTGAWLAMFFITTEALIGAGLVIFEWVADNASMGRAVSIAIHLANTFLLLAWITLTAWWASGGKPLRLTGHRGEMWALGLGFLGVLLLGVTGAITALGDTLFPSASLAEGLQQDFSASAHFLIRLRVFHPLIAIGVGFYLVLVAGVLGLLRSDRFVKRFALAIVVLFIIQFGVGITNILLLAPIPIQLLHLLLADLVWITLVLLAAATLTEVEVSIQSPESEQPVAYVETQSAS
ncbi:MAG TPA: COX15/CtaA family protein [Anaerolineales bacterium]